MCELNPLVKVWQCSCPEITLEFPPSCCYVLGYPTFSLADARQKARQAKEQLSYGNNPARSTDNPEMFKAAFQSFIDRHVSQNKSGSETVRIFHHDLLPAFWGAV